MMTTFVIINEWNSFPSRQRRDSAFKRNYPALGLLILNYKPAYGGFLENQWIQFYF